MKAQTKTKEEKQNMTRTTELLKEIEDINKSIPYTQSLTCVPLAFKRGELEGRLEAMKELDVMITKKRIGASKIRNKVLIELSNFLKEQIKMIEDAGVGK